MNGVGDSPFGYVTIRYIHTVVSISSEWVALCGRTD